MTPVVFALLLGGAASHDPVSYFEEGRARYAEGQYAQALRAFQRSYELEPVPAMLVNIGQTLRALGRSREAAQAFERFLESRWGTPRVRAQVWETLDDLKSKERPTPAPAGNPDPTAVEHFQRGRTFYARGDYEHALAEFRAAYLLDPRPALIVNIGQCLRRLDRLGEAVAGYRSFLEQSSGTPQVRAEVWEALDELERELDRRMYRLAESAVQFRRYLASNAGDPELRVLAADLSREVLDDLVRLDEQASRPLDVQALRVRPLDASPAALEIARNAPRPLLRIHGQPPSRAHAKAARPKHRRNRG